MKNHPSRHSTPRKPVRNTISMAVLATLIASGAHAADTSFSEDISNQIVNGYVVSGALVQNSGLINATNSGAIVGTTVTGTQTGNTTSTTANTIAAGATANSVTQTLELSQIVDGATAQGVATLGIASNTGAVSSQANGNTLAVTLTEFENGSVANQDNTISATTVVNRGVSTIAGTVPVNYTSTIEGSTGITDNVVKEFNAAASIVSTSAQQTIGAAATATASGNRVNLELIAPNAGTALPSAALTGNTISASTKGNSTASTIAIEAGGAPTFTGSAVLSNTQLGSAASATASNAGSQILGSVSGGGTVMTGTLAVTGNTLSSSAQGNETLGTGSAAGNRILLGDGLSFTGPGSSMPGATLTGYADGTALSADLVILNTQSNQTAPVKATTSSGNISASVESLTAGTVDLSLNSIKASATGNAASSMLASGANAASFSGSVAVASQQDNTDSSVAATTTGASLQAGAGDVTNGTVSLSSNRTSANARGNEISQSLALDATTLTLGTTAVLTDALGSVTATGAATVSNRQVSDAAPIAATTVSSQNILSTGAVSASTLTLGSNTQEAVALANNAANALSLNGTTVGTGAGIASVQQINAGSAVTSSLTNNDLLLQTADVTDGTVSATNNLQRAIGYGNLATHNLSVTATTVTGIEALGVASTINLDTTPASKALTGEVNAGYGIRNDQSVLSDVSASATNAGTGSVSINTGSLDNSKVANEGNAFAAAAYGNNATTGLTLNSTSISSTDNLGGPAFSSMANITSTQAVDAAITATAIPGAVALTRVNGDVSASTVSASGNNLESLATGSLSSNALNVTANSVATGGVVTTGSMTSGGFLAGLGSSTQSNNASFSLLNVQSGQGSVTATQSPISAQSDVRIAVTGDVTGSSLAAEANTSTASATSNSTINALNMNAGSLASSSALQNVQSTRAGVNALIGAASTVGAPNQGGVTLAIDGAAITNADLSVSGNVTRGFAAGNRVSNSTSLQGNDIATGSDSALATAGFLGAEIGAQADHTVSNTQSMEGAPIDSQVYGALAIDVAPGANIEGSSLQVSNNTQGASAVGNTAGNSLALQGNSVTAVSALQSQQSSLAAVNAASDLELFAPGGVTNSTVRVSGNSNSSLAVMNDATNSLSVSGSQVGVGLSQAGTTSADFLFPVVNAEHALSNAQIASDAVSSTATTRLYNQEAAISSNDLTSSSLTISGNRTAAEASANRALNTASVSGTSTQAASVALGNNQLSYANVTADASTAANVGLSSLALNSTGLIDSNSTTALARGNTATNALNSLAGSAYGTSSGGSVDFTGISVVSANAGILNRQENIGSVSATSTAARYQVALNSGNTSGSVGVTGNQVAAQAYGNSATNSMTLNALNTNTPTVGATAALGNAQYNRGAITATVTSVAYGVGITGPVSNSTLRTNGNQITATAVGNSVVSSILAAR